jgi:hypothetical protein
MMLYLAFFFEISIAYFGPTRIRNPRIRVEMTKFGVQKPEGSGGLLIRWNSVIKPLTDQMKK